MGEIIILDKNKAEKLNALGFRCKHETIDKQDVFIFIQSKELMQELNSNFEKGSFFIKKTVNL